MTKRALPSALGDIVQQRRIDLAAAYRLLCRFSLNDSIDSPPSVFQALNTFFLSQSFGVWFRLETACNRITVDINCDSFDDPCRLGINPAGFAMRAQSKSMKHGIDRLKTPRTAYERSTREDHFRSRRYGCDLG
ncbi:hypothetical protein GGD66_002217 [Bradyrhizobium sp. CIR48]|uniref:hypothetical protein n=1 Tax=Bradyrhizobium sp. CIR48 TaxID=2663840 RepID=UPI001606AD62|nr:hypothetical protein [Bradyrhizobium sp. CIR48]MBB4423673.1 hypothetical protein [Bradyrhizobium sp. CIR48]